MQNIAEWLTKTVENSLKPIALTSNRQIQLLLQNNTDSNELGKAGTTYIYQSNWKKIKIIDFGSIKRK